MWQQILALNMGNLLLIIFIVICCLGLSPQAQSNDSVSVDFSVLNDMIAKRPAPQPLIPVPAAPVVIPPLPAAKPSIPATDINGDILIKMSEVPAPQTVAEEPIIQPDQSLKLSAIPPVPKKMSISYRPGEIAPSGNIRAQIEKQILIPLKNNSSLRIALYSFATATEDGQSSGKRASLARALAFREVLTNNGIDPSRIDLLPQGEKTETLPKDRIDIHFITP